MKLLKLFFGVDKQIKIMKQRPGIRLLSAILGFGVVAATYFLGSYVASEYALASQDASHLVMVFLAGLLEIGLFVATIEFIIYEIAIFIMSIQSLAHKDRIGLSIITLLLSLVYIVALALVILYAIAS